MFLLFVSLTLKVVTCLHHCQPLSISTLSQLWYSSLGSLFIKVSLFKPSRTRAPKHQDLMPDDLRWRWHNKNRNKMHIPKAYPFYETGLWCRKVGDHSSRWFCHSDSVQLQHTVHPPRWTCIPGYHYMLPASSHFFFFFFFLQISFFFSLYLLFSEVPSKDLTRESTWDAWAHKGPRGDLEGDTCVPWHGVKMVCLWLFLGRASVNLNISFSKD